MKIEIMDNQFELLPQKAIYWKETNTLLIADLHLGKVTHFRKAGIAIPSIASNRNFSRLEELLNLTGASRIIILGDFFHHAHNAEWDQFATWRHQHPHIKIMVVLGNHDILPERLFSDIDVRLEDHLAESNFFFTHHPFDSPDQTRFTFCGHIHPVYCLRNFAKQSLKFPCFVIDPYQAILPSFGIFTGGYEMNAEVNRRIYLVADGKIIAV